MSLVNDFSALQVVGESASSSEDQDDGSIDSDDHGEEPVDEPSSSEEFKSYGDVPAVSQYGANECVDFLPDSRVAPKDLLYKVASIVMELSAIDEHYCESAAAERRARRRVIKIAEDIKELERKLKEHRRAVQLYDELRTAQAEIRKDSAMYRIDKKRLFYVAMASKAKADQPVDLPALKRVRRM